MGVPTGREPNGAVENGHVEELPPSKLGTKAHWDEVYERENRVFEDTGDEGEVWFGEEVVSLMRAWAVQHLPPPPTPLRVLECGSGNGTLLLSFLTTPHPDHDSDSSLDAPIPQSFHLTGIDYSSGSVALSRSVETARRQALVEDEPEEETINDCVVEWRQGDLLRDTYQETWDLVLDKGTYDALCLSQKPVEGDKGGRLPSQVYPERIAGLVREGGFFLITSCNFTEDEIKSRFAREELSLRYQQVSAPQSAATDPANHYSSSVEHPKFTFGGRSGSVVCTVAFQKVSRAPKETVNGTSTQVNGVSAHVNGVNGHAKGTSDDLYICIDCGGTKTDVAIATDSGVVARAIGGTGNMAEVGLQLSFEIICSTVLSAISNLPAFLATPSRLTKSPGRCPVSFVDIWVGISGCDTPLDQSRMSALLSPFFGHASVPILNDAHLLGGALLTHHCDWGVAVIAGTGSVVISLEVNKEGEVVQSGRRGGTGYLLGDDGSAFDLGRCAIRYAIDDYDAGLEAPGSENLAGDIRRHFEVQETGEVLAKVYDLDPSLSPSDSTNERKLRISSLSRFILERYLEGDDVARRAVYMAAGLLADSALSLIKQLQRERGVELDKGALVMGGGVIRQQVYRGVVTELLERGGVKFGIESVVEDVAGEGALGLVERARKGKQANGQ